jgi:hypothetical protein
LSFVGKTPKKSLPLLENTYKIASFAGKTPKIASWIPGNPSTDSDSSESISSKATILRMVVVPMILC